MITARLDVLLHEGYIGKDWMVTEKGFEVLNHPAIHVRKEPFSELSDLDLLCLRYVTPSMRDEQLSRLFNVDYVTVTAKLAKLNSEGLITTNYTLTEEGYNELFQESNQRTEPAAQSRVPAGGELGQETNVPTKTVIIQREIVRVPCKYCGTLNDIATQRFCPNCGAPVK